MPGLLDCRQTRHPYHDLFPKVNISPYRCDIDVMGKRTNVHINVKFDRSPDLAPAGRLPMQKTHSGIVSFRFIGIFSVSH